MTCALGHGVHETVDLDIDLIGAYAHDFASFPESRRTKFSLEVFNYPRYESPRSGFCPGREGSHAGLLEQRIWESWETRLVTEILATSRPSVVFDFGANVGWYSLLAMAWGHEAHAWEADRETYDVLLRNLDRAGGDFTAIQKFIDSKSEIGFDREVLLLKSDVEGFEPEVIKACKGIRPQYMLLEISPCFRPGYAEMLEEIVARGYDLFRVPNKECPYLGEFSADPLAVIERTRIDDPTAFVGSIRQENVLLRRR